MSSSRASEQPGPGAGPSGDLPVGEPPGASADADAVGQAEAEVARLEDRLKRALADLDNFRKRTARELDRRVTEAADAVVADWLEVADSIDRAVAAAPDGPAAEGLGAVADQIAATLAREGVSRIGVPGERFDPEAHEAVDVRMTPDATDWTIFEVARAGYVRGDRLLRPAQVVVARRLPPPAPAG
jgi:molecular chaperone GrpE